MLQAQNKLLGLRGFDLQEIVSSLWKSNGVSIFEELGLVSKQSEIDKWVRHDTNPLKRRYRKNSKNG